ncbi:energy transducer TonB [Luteimonas aquatica]|uniref:energy transducer TonB n=1 Tax=Luteimonas aquatica TaxID=450364 RepID=UPI001F565D2B|nr:energy transducer TonB [Luteimonas aquatica]
MSDPHRPFEDPSVQDPPSQDAEPSKSVSPLIWILLLIALIAFAWYFYNQHASAPGQLDTVPPNTESALVAPEGGDRPDAATAAGKSGKATGEKAAPRTVAKAEKPRNREVALIGRPDVDYPREAFRAGEEGTVTVVADIDAAGRVSSVRLAQRSGSRTLDRAAMTEVRRWKFRPAMKDGKAVASSVKVPVDYRLDKQ